MFCRRVAGDDWLCMFEGAYYVAMTSMNRGLPIAIAVYRYCCVFHDKVIKSPNKKQAVQNLLVWFIVINTGLNVFIYFKNISSFQRYVICMGREEIYEFDVNDFYVNKSFGPLTNMPLSNLSRFIPFN